MVTEMLLNSDIPKNICSNDFTLPKGTSWSLLGPGVEVGLTPSFIDYILFSFK